MRLDILAQPGRRLFIILAGLTFFIFAALVGVVWLIAGRQTDLYYHAVAFLITAMILFVLALFAIGMVGLMATLYLGRVFPLFSNIVRFIINFLFPVLLQAGRMLGVDPERVQSSFIDVNNHLVLMKSIQLKPEEILLLAPHCLQRNDCPHKITKHIDNCKRCGRCRVHDLLNLKSAYGINMAVVTGGTLARKFILEFRPRAVVAIACERDLTSGILDSYPLPVLGVSNLRPNGPCSETSVATEIVEKSLNSLIRRR